MNRNLRGWGGMEGYETTDLVTGLVTDDIRY